MGTPKHKLPAQLFLSVLAAIFLIVLSCVSFAAFYEDANGLISITPDIATPHSGGVWANITFCNKMGDDFNSSMFMMFDNVLSSIDWNYIDAGSEINLSNLVNYTFESPADFGLTSGRNNIYDFNYMPVVAGSCNESKIYYDARTTAGQWDTGVTGQDTVTRDVFSWEIDPYFNNTLYTNYFSSDADIGDINTTATSNTIVYGGGSVHLINLLLNSYVDEYTLNSGWGSGSWGSGSHKTGIEIDMLYNMNLESAYVENNVNPACSHVELRNANYGSLIATSNSAIDDGAGHWQYIFPTEPGLTSGTRYHFVCLYGGAMTMRYKTQAAPGISTYYHLYKGYDEGGERADNTVYAFIGFNITSALQNPTYGELISKPIPNIGNFQRITCGVDAAFQPGQSIILNISNNNYDWNVISFNDQNRNCGEMDFPNPGNFLIYNLTFISTGNPDPFTPYLYNFNVTILDWNSNVTTDVNYTENVTEGYPDNIFFTVTAPIADVTNVTATFMWNGVTSYPVNDLFNLSYDGIYETYVKSVNITTPPVMDFYQDVINSVITYDVITPEYDVIGTIPVLQYNNLNYATLKVCAAGDDTIVLYFNNSDEDNPTNPLNMAFEADMLTYSYNYVHLSELNFSVNNTNNVAICLSNNVSVLVNASMTDDTSFVGGKKQRWFLLNQTIMNGSIPTISMYNRNSFVGVSQLNGVAVSSSGYAPFNGIYVYLERYYPGEALWRVVQEDKTDNNGQFTFNVREVDTDYKLVFVDWYVGILRTTDTLKFLCTGGICSLTFIVPTSPEIIDTFISGLAFEPTTELITASWSDPDHTSGNVRVLVDKEYSNQSQTVICDEIYTAIPDIETCDVSNYDGDVIERIYEHATDQTPNSEEVFNVGASYLSNIIDPKEAAFYIFCITIVIVLASVYSPVATVVMLFAGFAGMTLLNISSLLTTSVLMTIGVLCFVVAVRVRH